ncbi:hypothetical protein ODE01S_12920 [Oceanithermus desulfurans NBRC 100063]|uniref:Uncharacterized protein n=1 Tax=Oceanithermus desulfurans NBRC 100063 TaxID=1227550 RepID=A0A511RJM8_9DEIN|nr:hypothetical protein ODE01S_12920 [Oceanithermus desulfurans NBRC 100063]
MRAGEGKKPIQGPLAVCARIGWTSSAASSSAMRRNPRPRAGAFPCGSPAACTSRPSLPEAAGRIFLNAGRGRLVPILPPYPQKRRKPKNKGARRRLWSVAGSG